MQPVKFVQQLTGQQCIAPLNPSLCPGHLSPPDGDYLALSGSLTLGAAGEKMGTSDAYGAIRAAFIIL